MIDWTRATVTVKAPVIQAAFESPQEFEMPLANLLALMRESLSRLVDGLCADLGHMHLPSLGNTCVRCGGAAPDEIAGGES